MIDAGKVNRVAARVSKVNHILPKGQSKWNYGVDVDLGLHCRALWCASVHICTWDCNENQKAKWEW